MASSVPLPSGPAPRPPRRRGSILRYAGRLLGAAAIGIVGAALLLELGLRLADLERTLAESGALYAPSLYQQPNDPPDTFRRDVAGTSDLQQHVHRTSMLTPEEVVRVTAADVRWLAETARARGIPMVVITYPINLFGFVPTNEGIERGAKEAGIPVVSSIEALQRVMARGDVENATQLFDPSVHPNQILYDEVGAMVLDELDRQRWLPQ